VFRLIVIAGSLAGAVLLRAQNYVRDSEPKLFSYDELVQLNSNRELSPELAEKLRVITTTPFINNEAYLAGARPRPLEVAGLGPSLRIAFWNIERGLELNYIQLLLRDKDAFIAKVVEERNKANKSGKRIRDVELEKIPQEIETLKAADVWRRPASRSSLATRNASRSEKEYFRSVPVPLASAMLGTMNFVRDQ
jgi:hypothetical protein